MLGNVRLAKPLRVCVCVCRSVEGVCGRRRGLLAGSGVGRGAAVSRQPARGESAPRAQVHTNSGLRQVQFLYFGLVLLYRDEVVEGEEGDYKE